MIEIRGQHDATLDAIAQALRHYVDEHVNANVVAYRQNSVSIRIRIIDEDLAGMSRADRHDFVWKYLQALPEDILSDVTFLLPLTPTETDASIANFDFEHPIPSSL